MTKEQREAKNKKPLDISWLPPAEEWDFRCVTAEECRVACHWEYGREIWKMSSGMFFKPGEVRKAWPAMTKAERECRVDRTPLAPVLQIRTFRDALNRAQISEPDKWLSHFERAYVLRPNFSACGVQAIIKEFESWARKEAKKYKQAPRAKAAELPFDLLKWLAVLRLDEQRKQAGMTYKATYEALRVYQQSNRCPDPNGVFPIYASQGAWSKARKDADGIRIKVIHDPSFLLGGLYVQR